MVQKPSVRPGRSPRARPTGAPQSDREQKRFRSGTSGFPITTERGSGRGTTGTDTSPAPSLPRPDRPVDEPELRADTDRDDPVPPAGERDSRPDTERRDDRDDDRDEDRELPVTPSPPPAIPVGGDDNLPDGETTGARPHVPQYSSPPPMSSYEPSQPGR
ncbi:hypothetical protein GCM10010393_05580 [Streptomyces gobitricini]|uniref:Uncharacterized protein n=1 Tax=Streptomyces gobitricini TaxID=68211 RepID=A0ABN3L5P9_9ACTN